MRKIFYSATALFLAGAIHAESIRYIGVPNASSMKIDGTSTIHDWTVETKVIGGFIELESNFPLDPSKEAPKDLKLTPRTEVNIPVRQLKSGKSMMDTVMHNAMKAEDHPRIEYRLIEMTSKGKTDAGLKFGTKGTIKVGGVIRTNEFDVIMTKTDDKKIKVTGETKVKMTDFGIEPPAPKIALGAIKTANDVKLTFEWITAQKKAE